MLLLTLTSIEFAQAPRHRMILRTLSHKYENGTGVPYWAIKNDRIDLLENLYTMELTDLP
jgi:hypothetical protein